MDDIAYAQELQRSGLDSNWEQEDEEGYSLITAWWQTCVVRKVDDGQWIIGYYDHDAGVNDDGTLYTAYEERDDERFPTWVSAAKEVEQRYLRRS